MNIKIIGGGKMFLIVFLIAFSICAIPIGVLHPDNLRFLVYDMGMALLITIILLCYRED